MRSRRSKRGNSLMDRRNLLTALVLCVFFVLTINCTREEGSLHFASAPEPEVDPSAVVPITETPKGLPLNENHLSISSEMWAEAFDGPDKPRSEISGSGNISLDLVDANLLDVLSLLAYKLDANIIFLEESSEITLKTDNLSPMTTFQLILQMEDLDYLTIGRNYVVGQRDRLYSDFANRMLLTRYSLFYVSPQSMEGYLSELGVPVQSLTVDTNQQALWMQGTASSLGKAREIINTLDVMENASFAEGGARKIRMPIAYASGQRAEEELEALIDLLSILLDGFRDGRTDMGWITWDHPDPIPHIYMEWESPVIKPYDIKMKITRDFANDYSKQIRYLIAEGTPANIDLVSQMIETITRTPDSPLSFTEDETNGDDNGNDNNSADSLQYLPSVSQQSYYTETYNLTARAVPASGGTISGGGTYDEGDYVTVTAAPSDGFAFVRWIEGGSELTTASSYSFYIYANRSLEAVFIALDEGEGDADSESEDDTEE